MGRGGAGKFLIGRMSNLSGVDGADRTPPTGMDWDAREKNCAILKTPSLFGIQDFPRRHHLMRETPRVVGQFQ